MSTYKCSACGFENEPTGKFCGNCGRDLSECTVGSNWVGVTILGRYKIRRIIAVGGMGVVYEADQSLGDYHRTVAIKMLRPELSQDQIVVSRFNRECGIVAQLTHPNTVSLYDYGSTEDGTLYIAMEFVRGQAFSEVIAAGALTLPRTLHIVDQVCHSLEEAHGLGIVHRDLKPDNVILTQQGAGADFVKLLDFGIAVRLSAGSHHETKLTQQGMVLGTPPYMSPEQFTGARVARQSDIYSLGVIVYEALTGRLPFEAENPWMWAQRHLTAMPPDLPSTFPPEVVQTVRAALSKDPASRPRSAIEFSRLLAGAPTAESSGLGAMFNTSAVRLEEQAKTQPDALPLTSNTPTTSRVEGPVAKTDPAAPPVMDAYRPILLDSPPLGSDRSIASAYGKPWSPAVPYRKPRGANRGLLIGAILGGAVTVCAVGVAIAYSMDLFENPFYDGEPPTAYPSLPVAPTGASSASQAQGPAQELSPTVQSASSYDSVMSTSTRTHSHVSVPMPSSSANHSGPAPSSPAPSSSAPGGFGVPPFSLPTSFPSLPSSLPTLPTSIGGIPIPQIFPGPSPSPAPSVPSP